MCPTLESTNVSPPKPFQRHLCKPVPTLELVPGPRKGIPARMHRCAFQKAVLHAICHTVPSSGDGGVGEKEEEINMRGADPKCSPRSEHESPLRWLRGQEPLLNHISQGAFSFETGSKQVKGGMTFT